MGEFKRSVSAKVNNVFLRRGSGILSIRSCPYQSDDIRELRCDARPKADADTSCEMHTERSGRLEEVEKVELERSERRTLLRTQRTRICRKTTPPVETRKSWWTI